MEFPPTKNVVYLYCLKNNLICCYFQIHLFSIVNCHGPGLTEGETKEQWGDQVFEAKIALMLGVVDVPFRFVKRIRR